MVLKPAVEAIKAKGICARVASPRILKPSEEKIFIIFWQYRD
ncbi:MAG: hypothetical protein R2865_05790 [Deinococcales bacterium]